MAKILLLGSTGLLGSAFVDYFNKHKIEFVAPIRAELDLLDFEKVRRIFTNNDFSLVINASGYNFVDKAEESKAESILCHKLNVEVPLNLAKVMSDICPAIKLIHFSSDYVFNGQDEDGYIESDAVDPISVYAKSKAESEVAVMDNFKNAVVVRISWLFGPHKTNFIEKVLENYDKNHEIKVINDSFGKPTYTVDVVESLMQNIELMKPGIYHLPNESSMSWYDFAKYCLLKKYNSPSIVAIDSTEFMSLAKRPKYSILLNEKLPKLRSSYEAIDEYLDNYLV